MPSLLFACLCLSLNKQSRLHTNKHLLLLNMNMLLLSLCMVVSKYTIVISRHVNKYFILA